MENLKYDFPEAGEDQDDEAARPRRGWRWWQLTLACVAVALAVFFTTVAVSGLFAP